MDLMIHSSIRSKRMVKLSNIAGQGQAKPHDTALWDQLQSMGIVAMAVPEAAGGWGASPLDLALIAEQHGRHVAPAPIIEKNNTMNPAKNFFIKHLRTQPLKGAAAAATWE